MLDKYSTDMTQDKVDIINHLDLVSLVSCMIFLQEQSQLVHFDH